MSALSLVGTSNDKLSDTFEIQASGRRIRVEPHNGRYGVSLNCSELLDEPTLARRYWTVTVLTIDTPEPFAVFAIGETPDDNFSSDRRDGLMQQYPVTDEGKQLILEAAQWWYVRRYEDRKCVVGTIAKFVPEPA